MTGVRKSIRRAVIILLSLIVAASGCLTANAASSNSKYWLKVNEECNVVTAYKNVKGEWKPIRAMLCSTGLRQPGKETPRGTFYLSGRRQWGLMFFGVYAQYCTTISGDYLFHSVHYLGQGNYKSQPTKEFNKLGQHASHGCVRLSVMDAKWIYENCKAGTKVTIYRSSKPGPMGKPEGIKVSTKRAQYWDPTDPNPNNPYYIIKKPEIKIGDKKKFKVNYGSKYTLKKYVTAEDPNTYMNLTSLLKVNKVIRYSKTKGKYVKTEFSTKTVGKYKIQYKVKDKYSGTSYKTIRVEVVDNRVPVISGAKDRVVNVNEADAAKDVAAKLASKDLTKKIKVFVKAPDKEEYEELSYEQAAGYIFAVPGEYKVKYVAENSNNSKVKAEKEITVTAETKLQ